MDDMPHTMRISDIVPQIPDAYLINELKRRKRLREFGVMEPLVSETDEGERRWAQAKMARVMGEMVYQHSAYVEENLSGFGQRTISARVFVLTPDPSAEDAGPVTPMVA